MRGRIWALIILALVLVVATACAGARIGRAPANSPVPTKTLRPTFTFTPQKPAATATPAPAQATEAPAAQAPAAQATAAQATAVPAAEQQAAATALPPTAAPTNTPEPEAATFTVASGALNVRTGPGVAFPVIGRLANGDSFPVTGKNDAGSWYEFDYEGRKGWVSGSNVSIKGADQIALAEEIPVPPTAAPRPTARPQPRPQPAQPPAQPAPQPQPANNKYAVSGSGFRPDTNEWITVYCLLFNKAGEPAAGTIRVLRDGQPVAPDVSFTQFGTYYLDAGYNAGCKVEIRPASNGNYTAVLVEGGQVVSDPISFNVSGPANRINFVAWKQR